MQFKNRKKGCQKEPGSPDQLSLIWSTPEITKSAAKMQATVPTFSAVFSRLVSVTEEAFVLMGTPSIVVKPIPLRTNYTLN